MKEPSKAIDSKRDRDCHPRLVVPWSELRWSPDGVAKVGTQDKVDEMRAALKSGKVEQIRQVVCDGGGEWNGSLTV